MATKIRPTTGTKREEVFAIKVGDEEKEILEIAAELTDMNVSHFIMNCALKRACEVCEAEATKKYKEILSKVQPLITKE